MANLFVNYDCRVVLEICCQYDSRVIIYDVTVFIRGYGGGSSGVKAVVFIRGCPDHDYNLKYSSLEIENMYAQTALITTPGFITAKLVLLKHNCCKIPATFSFVRFEMLLSEFSSGHICTSM